jgi:hypothetical protein
MSREGSCEPSLEENKCGRHCEMFVVKKIRLEAEWAVAWQKVQERYWVLCRVEIKKMN